MDLSVFSTFSNAKILVVGDVMLDRYLIGDCQRISPEAPVPVVKVSGNEDKLGGAANVARNIAHLGAQVGLLGIVGKDEDAERFRQLLGAEDIQYDLVEQGEHPTISKLRVISRRQQVVRVDLEERFESVHAAELADRLQSAIAPYDVVVFSDYDKGSLGQIAGMIRFAKLQNKRVLVDPKNRDLGCYAGADVITPNMSEFSASGGDASSEKTIAASAREMLAANDIASIVLTRSEKGMSVITPDDVLDVPADALEVSDVTGAGDTVVATLAVAMAAGLTLNDAAKLANLAAGIAVGRFGAVAVHVDELAMKLHERIFAAEPGGLHTVENILPQVRFARRTGRKIVFTNGCFDVIHAGHVGYLSQAKAMGDFLIVGLNTDDSVRRLKGPNRPIHTWEQRATVLGALESVDWVIPFGDEGDDTPLELIKAVEPDVLVKGGDYTVAEVVGADEVLAAGGSVEIVDLVEGCSTSSILEKL